MTPPHSPTSAMRGRPFTTCTTQPSSSFTYNSLTSCSSNTSSEPSSSSSASSAEHAHLNGAVAHASVTDVGGSPLRPVQWRSASELHTIPPALPESPEIIVQPAKVTVAVPRSGTRPPGHGLALSTSLSPLSGPPISRTWRTRTSRDSRDSFNSHDSRDSYMSHLSRESRDSDALMPPAPLATVLPPQEARRTLPVPPVGRPQFSSSTPSLVLPSLGAPPPRPPRAHPPPPIHAQPLPPVPRRHGPNGSLGIATHSLGRQLPPTLTESLELLVQVKEHCLELERLTSVPEEPTSPDMPTRLQPPQVTLRRRSFNAMPSASQVSSGGIRRATEPAVSYASTTLRPHPNRASSSSDSSELSTTSGEWPETPNSGTFALSSTWTSASASVPALHKPIETLVAPASSTFYDDADTKARRRAVKAMRSCTQLHTTTSDMPSLAKIMYAAELDVVSEDGQSVPFAALIDAPGHSRTVVVFIRHFLSPSCAAYLRALIAELTPPLLARTRSRVVVIGLGSASVIRGFRQHLQCPFAVYTDPTRRLHDVLGLAPRALSNAKSEYSASGFKHARDMLVGAARMHSMRGAGNRSQLGGEFVFEGTERVLLAHRMVSGADHAPLKSVIDAISVPCRPERPARPAPTRPYTPVQPLCVQRRSTTYTSGFKAPFKLPYASRSCNALNEAPATFRMPVTTSTAEQARTPKPSETTPTQTSAVPPPHPAPMSLAFPLPPTTGSRHTLDMPWGQQRSRSRQGCVTSTNGPSMTYVTHSSVATHTHAAHSKHTSTPGRVAIVHPEDIDRVTGELRELCSRRSQNVV